MRKGKIVLGIGIIIGGLLLTTGCKAKLKNGEEVAIKINGKNITADDLYKELKEKYADKVMIDEIDKKIFNVIYKDDEEIQKQVDNQMEYLKSTYKNDWEDTLKNAGYDSEDDLIEELKLNYQRNKAIEDYIKESITDKEIKEYYENESVGDIKASHILIKVSTTEGEGLSDEEAKTKAEDLINKLNDGADFATLAKENSEDTGSALNGGDLGYFNKGQMVKEFEEAAYNLKINEYTKTPVKTTYGYHIILKTDEKEKESLEKLADEIRETLADKKTEDDKTIKVTALDEIRKNYKLSFKDSSLKRKYNEYIEKEKENSKSN